MYAFIYVYYDMMRYYVVSIEREREREVPFVQAISPCKKNQHSPSKSWNHNENVPPANELTLFLNIKKESLISMSNLAPKFST